jgi:hypothetical protein
VKDTAEFRAGWDGEELIRIASDGVLVRPAPGERRWDLISTVPPFPRVEVKTDSHVHIAGAGNFFMERRTLIPGKLAIDGGPWRALRDGVDEFAYLFPNTLAEADPSMPLAYWFRGAGLTSLIPVLDAGIESKRYPYRRVRTGFAIAIGYLVPVSDLTELYDAVAYPRRINRPEDPGTEERNDER